MSAREWRPVPGYEGLYDVSSDGMVRSLYRGKPFMRKFGKTHDGYFRVCLTKNGQPKMFGVHRLVAMAFHPNDHGPLVRHLDGNPANNVVDNLRWGTVYENAQDTLAHGRNPGRKKTHCPQGHPYSPENTYTTTGRNRLCRECGRVYQRKYQARLKARRVAAREADAA